MRGTMMLFMIVEQILEFIHDAVRYILMVYYYDGVYLLSGIIIAVGLSIYIDPDRVRSLLVKRSGFSIWGSVAFGTFTPLCACGTLAVIVSMVVTVLPWGPIMAFLVSSPLMSPDVFVLLAGIVGLQFAVVLTVASILMGIAAGYISHVIEKHTGFLENQLRLKKTRELIECCAPKTEGKVPLLEKEDISNVLPTEVTEPEPEEPICCSEVQKDYFFGCCTYTEAKLKQKGRKTLWERLQVKAFLLNFYKVGVRRILPFFTLFAFLAYVVEAFVPAQWIVSLYGGEHFYSVPLAALVGLPLYVSSASAVPLLERLIDAGASQGSVLAFMIAGPGTSVAVISGLAIIMKRKAILLYILFVFVGAILSGYLYDLFLGF